MQAPGSEHTNSRSRDLSTAIRLSLLTIAWNALVGTAAVLTATVVGSLSLGSFGLSATLDSIASGALVWRFRTEVKDSTRGHGLEETTIWIVGTTLVLVALFVAAQAARSLWSRSGPEVTALAVVIASSSLLVLPPLARRKIRVATRLGSRALRGDGALTAIGAILAALSLVGLGLDSLFGWWWSDAVAALVMSGFLVREGVLTLNETE